jgi:TRAP-type C4-dicarboxylate transport system permease large subunit
MMKKSPLKNFMLLSLVATTLGSCQVIGQIFKAGVWTGALLVVLVIAVIIYLATRLTRRK